MKAVSTALAQFRQEDIALLEKEGQYNLTIDDEPDNIADCRSRDQQ